MTQIFGIHYINGLPDNISNTYQTKDLYNIPLIENLSDNLAEIKTQSSSSVYITSDPVGAQIFIDGIEQTGFSTPAMIMNIPSGHHNFRLISPGYEDIESAMPIDPGRTYNIFLTMGKSISTTAYISTPDIMVLLAVGLIGYYLIRNR